MRAAHLTKLHKVGNEIRSGTGTRAVVEGVIHRRYRLCNAVCRTPSFLRFRILNNDNALCTLACCNSIGSSSFLGFQRSKPTLIRAYCLGKAQDKTKRTRLLNRDRRTATSQGGGAVSVGRGCNFLSGAPLPLEHKT